MKGNNEKMDALQAVAVAQQDKVAIALLTVTGVEGAAPSRVGMSLAVTRDGTTYGSLGCDGFDRAGADDASAVFAGRKVISSYYPWEEGAGVVVEVKLVGPGEGFVGRIEIIELLVVGTGPVARAVASLAEAMGYHVRVAAGPRSPSVGEFDGADEVIVAQSVEEVVALRPGADTYVVICGHDEEYSIPVLKALAETDVPYIGMMGSRRHTSHLYRELKDKGLADAKIARIHTPVGIDIAAETPEEIALSVLAQITAVRRGSARARHLSEGIFE